MFYYEAYQAHVDATAPIRWMARAAQDKLNNPGPLLTHHPLVRSAAAGLNRYGVRANAVAPIARTRMMAEVPMELPETGEPEDVAPMVTYLLSDLATHITGQIYTVVGGKIAVWNQPHEVRAMFKDGRWTPEEIARRLDATIGQEPMPILAQLEAYRRAAAAAAETGVTPNA